MNQNMGLVDRILRVLAAAIIGALYFTHQITGTLAVVLGAVAILSLVTGLTGWCWLYALLGVSTRKAPHAASTT